MCGICGEVRFDQQPASLDSIPMMLERLAPRGPDGRGILVHNNVALGHHRLKIIDLSDHARQPMSDPDLGLDIVFNGCIYNHRPLREELQGRGYSFFSSGDTEVILKSFHAWGADCVNRFNGMFAFAIHERQSGRVILARDRLGIKPLYLSDIQGGVRFASNLQALVAAGGVDTSLDPTALHHYLHWHAVVPPPHTILRGIRKLPPATVRVYEPDGHHHDQTYWQMQVATAEEDRQVTTAEWQEQLLAELDRAVQRRMIADVPVGVLLSGGVDSSLLVGLLARRGQEGLNTFSVGFEEAGGEKGDEFRYSDLIAKEFGTNHHKIFVPSSRLLETLPKTIGAMSEPMVSYDNVGFFLLSQEVAKHVKVVQSGQGADEVFGGYHWYPPLVASSSPVDDYCRVFFDLTPDQYRQAVDDSLLAEDYSRAFVAEHFARVGAPASVDKALRLDTTVMLADDPVKRVDNMTMAWGLEARVPFLDHQLIEFAGRIPSALKIRDGGKWILKEAARKVLPAEVIDRPKGYFPVPALKYIKGPYLELVRTALTGPTARNRNLFKADYIDTLLAKPDEHITPLRGSKLWQAAVLEMWLQHHGL